MSDQLESLQFCLGKVMSQLRVYGSGGRPIWGDIVVVCYTVPLQEDVVDESFFRKLEKPYTCRLLS